MKVVLWLASTLLLALPTAGLAVDQVALNEVVAALEKPFRPDTPTGQAIKDFAAEFRQHSRLVSLDREQSGQGQVQVSFGATSDARPRLARFRWEYTRPTNQEIISDGTTLWVYMPENNQVIQSELDTTREIRGDDPLTFLTGLGNLSRDFVIGWGVPERDPQGNFVLQLQPRRESPLIREMRIIVDQAAVAELRDHQLTGRRLPILSSTVIDPNGNTTLIEFLNARVNRGLPDAAFRFVIPEGVDVVQPEEAGLTY